MKRAVALLAVASVALTVTGAAFANHSWGKYHWARTTNPFTVKLGSNLSAGWGSYLNTASGDWSQSTVLDTTVVAGNGSNCSPASGLVEVCNGAYGQNGWLGIARIWTTRGAHITQAVVQVNDTYFNMPQYNSSSWRQMVVCQEVGHTFGLDHQDVNFDNPNLGTCMDYTSNPDGPPSNLHPNQHDYDQLVTIYSHSDRFTTVGSAPASLPGKAPSFSQASRANGPRYVDDLANGGKLITFVLWTPFGE